MASLYSLPTHGKFLFGGAIASKLADWGAERFPRDSSLTCEILRISAGVGIVDSVFIQSVKAY